MCYSSPAVRTAAKRCVWHVHVMGFPPTLQAQPHSAPTTPPITHQPTQYSITAVQQHGRQHTGKQGEVGRFLRLEDPVRSGAVFFVRPSAISGGKRAATHQAPTTHHPPPTQRPTNHSSITAVQHYVSTNPQRQYSRAAARTTAVFAHVRSEKVDGISTFLRFFVFPVRAFPGRAFSCSPLAELGTFARYVARDTEG